MNRRQAITGIVACSVVGLSGCVGGFLGPRPQVADTDTNHGTFSGAVGDSIFRVLVVNQGSRGEVRVRLKFVTESEVVIQEHSKTLVMGEDERRRVDFEINAPSDADAYIAEAEST